MGNIVPSHATSVKWRGHLQKSVARGPGGTLWVDILVRQHSRCTATYCRDNKEEVAKLRDHLISSGEPVWWDQDILPGQDWKFEVRNAMKHAYAVVLCLSKELACRFESGVYPEVSDAIEIYRERSPGSIFLIPVRLSDCEIPPLELDGTRTLNRLQYVDLFPLHLPGKSSGPAGRRDSGRAAPTLSARRLVMARWSRNYMPEIRCPKSQV
jgi:hypothetical protein